MKCILGYPLFWNIIYSIYLILYISLSICVGVECVMKCILGYPLFWNIIYLSILLFIYLSIYLSRCGVCNEVYTGVPFILEHYPECKKTTKNRRKPNSNMIHTCELCGQVEIGQIDIQMIEVDLARIKSSIIQNCLIIKR